MYKLDQWIPNRHLFTASLLVVFTLGFGLIGSVVAPKVVKIIEHGHNSTKKNAGKTGVLTFFLTAFLLIYVLYYVIYVKGVQFILPVSWR